MDSRRNCASKGSHLPEDHSDSDALKCIDSLR